MKIEGRSRWMRSAALLPCFISAAGFAAETRYRIDSTHSYAEFAVMHLGISTARGKFTNISGTIIVDPETGTGKIDAKIDAEAIVTGVTATDRVLRGPEFFDIEQHPTLQFVADKVDFTGGKLVQVEGSLTLLGVTKPVTLTIEHTACTKGFFTRFRDTCGADAVTKIRRSEFGMTRYASVVGDEVKINIAIEAVLDSGQREQSQEQR